MSFSIATMGDYYDYNAQCQCPCGCGCSLCVNRNYCKCLRRWNVNPTHLFDDCNFWWLLILGIPVFCMMVIGSLYFVQESKMPSYWIPSTERPVWNVTQPYSEVIPTTNCSLHDVNINTTFPALVCDSLPQNMTVKDAETCYYPKTCAKWFQTCQPCYYVCFTNDCWEEQQQEDCLKIAKNYACKTTYTDLRSTYTCTQDPNPVGGGINSTCKMNCPDFQCQPPTDYHCNCVNDYCLVNQTKICYIERTKPTVIYTMFYTYTVKGVVYTNSLITQKCGANDTTCKNNFLNQYQVTSIYYNKNNPASHITDWEPNHAGGTYAMVVIGAVAFAGILIWAGFFCCDVFRNCKRPPPTPKPPKQPKVIAPKPMPTQSVQMAPAQSIGQPTTHTGIQLTLDPSSKCIACGQPLRDSSLKVMPCRHTYHTHCTDKCIVPACNGLATPTDAVPSAKQAGQGEFDSIGPNGVRWHISERKAPPPVII